MAEQNSSKKIMWATIIIAIVLIAIIYPLTVKKSTSAADAAGSNDGADVRIQPVARFELAKAEAPAAGGAPRDGATIYNSVCGACHNTGAAGAPKIDDKGAWAPRLAQGKDGLIKSLTNGKGAMPPKGGANLSDAEIKGVIDYVVGKVK
jgi:cytochrome c5